MKKLYTLLSVVLFSLASNAQVVISQVYGGGGNGGATFTNDFIELFNRGTVAQSLNGWSVQYGSAAGTTYFVTRLPNMMLAPGKYFLIKQAAGATASTSLPTPDLDGLTCGCTYDTAAIPAVTTTGIAMSGSNGKVLLVNTIIAESTVNPAGAQIIDKVGYGATPAGFEGTGPTGTALTSTTSAQRKSAGCTDSDSNPSDFINALPVPRNSATAANVCVLAVNQNEISGLDIFPNPVTGNILNIQTAANEAKTVNVYDVLGKQVINVTTDNSTINVGNLNAGIYIVKVTEEGKTATRKLIVR